MVWFVLIITIQDGNVVAHAVKNATVDGRRLSAIAMTDVDYFVLVLLNVLHQSLAVILGTAIIDNEQFKILKILI
jgi:hypothetical protein